MTIDLERYLSGKDLPLDQLRGPRSEYSANLELSPLVGSTGWTRPSTRVKKPSWIARMSAGTLVTVSYFTGLVAGYCGAFMIMKLVGLI